MASSPDMHTFSRTQKNTKKSLFCSDARLTETHFFLPIAPSIPDPLSCDNIHTHILYEGWLDGDWQKVYKWFMNTIL